MNRRLRDVTRFARQFGRDVEHTWKGHLRLTHDDLPPLITPGPPGDWRSESKMCSDLRRVQSNKQTSDVTMRDDRIFEKVAIAALPMSTVILDRLGVTYRQNGGEAQMLNHTRDDRNYGSFNLNLRTGRWAEFATGDTGGDMISLTAYLTGQRQIDAAKELAAMLGVILND